MSMSKIKNSIDQLLQKNEKILSVFLTAGYPQKESFINIAEKVLNAGADLIEIGFPFSDPLADGKVIQYSSQVALKNGVILDDVFSYTSELNKLTNKPIILMGYANPINQYGRKKFAENMKKSGAVGLIVPDVPIEEYDDFFESNFDGIDIILLVTPTTPDERIKIIDQKSNGFVYCVSTTGTTGKSVVFDEKSIAFVKNTQKLLKKNKMLVGFGISDTNSVKSVIPYCDGVIVGSAVIKLLNENNEEELLKFINELKVSTKVNYNS